MVVRVMMVAAGDKLSRKYSPQFASLTIGLRSTKYAHLSPYNPIKSSTDVTMTLIPCMVLGAVSLCHGLKLHVLSIHRDFLSRFDPGLTILFLDHSLNATWN